jgi:hypothetical protein
MQRMSIVKNIAWRDMFNPLRGLTMARVVSLLESGERGQYADLQWFYHYMERSEAMIHAVIQRRRASLLSCDWDIRVSAEVQGSGFRVQGLRENGRERAQSGGHDKVLAAEQADVLRMTASLSRSARADAEMRNAACRHRVYAMKKTSCGRERRR